ncbi:hypothetical protein C8Q78DRAFT_1155694 [Trametes maxima]|nr:hypothetical protein C8Q78DRAFT_1155694 [Trametes maxima]
MERTPSAASRRIRKLSNSISHAVKRATSSGSSSTNPQTEEPQHQSRTAPRGRTRKVSVDQISKPKPDPRYSLDGWLANYNLNRDTRRDTSQPPQHSVQLSADGCTPYDRQGARPRYRSASVPRRPPRPQREEDLPYGAKGSVRIRDAPSFMVFPTVSTTTRISSPAQDSPFVPFPSTLAARRSASSERLNKPLPPLPAEKQRVASEGGAPVSRPRSPAPHVRAQKAFSPFAPMARGPEKRTSEKATRGVAGEISPTIPTPRSRTSPMLRRGSEKGKRDVEHVRSQDIHRASNEQVVVYWDRATRQPPGTRTSDTALLPLLSRSGVGPSNAVVSQASTPSQATPGLRQRRSLATRASHADRSPPIATTPRSPLNASFSAKPKPRGVPRDVTSTDHHRLSVLLGSPSTSPAQPRVRSLPVTAPYAHVAQVSTSSPTAKPSPRPPLRPVSPPQSSWGGPGSERTVRSRKAEREVSTRGDSEYPVTFYLDEIARGFGEVAPLPGFLDVENDGWKDATEPLRPRRKDRRTAAGASENLKGRPKEVGGQK